MFLKKLKNVTAVLIVLLLVCGSFGGSSTVYAADASDYKLVFDAAYYLNKYPDLRAAFGTDESAAFTHFLNHGMDEGRQASASFNVTVYRNNYSDLRAAFGDDLKAYYKHYINHGYAEHRTAVSEISSGTDTEQTQKTETEQKTEQTTENEQKTETSQTTETKAYTYNGLDYSAVFDPAYYLNKYADLKAAFGSDGYDLAFQHFLNHGIAEKRQASAEFSVFVYKANYADLRAAFRNNLQAYVEHYIKYGKAEKRNAATLMAGAQTDDSTQSHIVCIDAGHQQKSITEKEPLGPGSTTMKQKLSTGAQGVVTNQVEYDLNLKVSLFLKKELEARGYQVVMIRETNDCPLSNAERAEVANQSGAEIFVRVHANSVDDSSVRGCLTVAPTRSNPYLTTSCINESYTLSQLVVNSLSASTGFKNSGVWRTDEMTGINWSKIPVTIVEMGFLSNPTEDQLLATNEYRQKVAVGIANGIDAYFANK